MKHLTLSELGDILPHAAALSDVSETHGTLCGMLCSDRAMASEKWLSQATAEIDPEDTQVDSLSEGLTRLYRQSLAALEATDMSFSPLLPDDEYPIDQRTQALALWCQGYLYGLSIGKLPAQNQLPHDVREIMSDFSEISRATLEEGENPEETEHAYAELVEFVRVGVQLVFEELRSPKATTPLPPGHPRDE